MGGDDTLDLSRRKVLRLTGGSVGAGVFAGVTQATPGREPGPKEDEVLVGVSAGKGRPAEAVAKHVPASAEVVHENRTLRYAAVKFGRRGTERARRRFVENITNRPWVKYAEPNGTVEALYTPDDPKWSDQWAPQMVNADDAWDTTLGSSDVTISIVDTGLQYDHEDLAGAMSDAESNSGQDFVDDDEDPYPDDLSNEYHGTHVGGIAGAVTDNGTGVAGVSNSTLLSARVLNENGSGSFSDVADGVTWSADNGADVINMSLGASSGSSTLKDAVDYAYNSGAYIAAAAGNDGPCSDCVSYPAAYDNCVAVSALGYDEGLASYSSTGAEVELAAPGGSDDDSDGTSVLSTTTTSRGEYENLVGTSMATPVVSGVAGLALGQWNLTNTELRTHLNDTAVDVGLGDTEQGNGRVDAYNAVTTDPSDGGDGGDGGTCGDSQSSATVTDYLWGYWDADCWTWSWNFDAPCQAVVDLDGPSDADFDLYVHEGTAECPGPYDYDYASYSTDSQETITIDDPDTSTDLYVLVDSYYGSGYYDLSITEKST